MNPRCEVQLRRPNSSLSVVVTAETLDSEGFSCICEEPYSPGELLECTLLISGTEDLALHRNVRVLHVNLRGLEPGFGMVCRFEEVQTATS